MTSTEYLIEVVTESINFLTTDNINFDKGILFASSRYYTSIPQAKNLSISFTITFVGLVLNSLIFKYYWRVKTEIAVYIKTFAAFDMFLLLYQFIMQLIVHSSFIAYWLLLRILQGFNVCAAFLLVGPLFLALDRFLIVAFPHKFKLYETRMRILKIVLFVVTLGTRVGHVLSAEARDVSTLLVSVNLLLQLLACGTLYLFIVARVVISQRKLKTHRSTANT